MRKPILLLLAMLLLVGCNSVLEIGIERTPTPDVAPAATMTAMASEISFLVTRVASQVTPIPPAPPDLGRLAYVQGGDIWIKTLPVGTPQRLTTDGHNSSPRWSPSGQWLAFRKERQVMVEQACDVPKQHPQICLESVPVMQMQVWVVEADGNSMHLLGQGASIDAFAWSPVDDRLAYSTAKDGLSMINADGTDLVALAPQTIDDSDGLGSVGHFVWNPDGALIAYEWWVQSLTQTLMYQGLWQVSVDEQERVELYSSSLPQKGEAILAGWSPQGRRVLFWQSETPLASVTDGAPLYSINADGGQPEANALAQLETEEMTLSYTDFIAPAPRSASSTLRDGVALVVGSSRSTWRNKRIELAGRSISPSSWAAISPAWSPDGMSMAFVAAPDRADLSNDEAIQMALMQRRIWVTDVAGAAQPRRITEGATYREEWPLWSADSGYLLFARMDAKGRASLWLTTVAGGAPRQVVDELTPAPDPVDSYGHIDWKALFDWWRGM
jgi:Tol biopolymer transport system component